MGENKEKIIRSGFFNVFPEYRLGGTLSLDGPDSILHVWSDTAIDIEPSEIKTILGVLDNQKKVSLIGCIYVHEGRYYGEGGVSYHYKFFPHYVVIGNCHISHNDRSIFSVSFVIDDAMTLFHDNTSFGTLIMEKHESRKLLSSVIPDRISEKEFDPIISYYTGKHEIFSVDTVIGRIYSYHSPSHNMGGPQGVHIQNQIYTAAKFDNPVSIEEMESRMRRILCFFEVVIGRPQNLLEINTDRIIRAANMFDLIPRDEFPPKVPLQNEITTMVVETKKKFQTLPRSDERDMVLGVLGRLEGYSLKQKIRRRADILTKFIDDSIREINTVTDAAVDCRNLYVHGSDLEYNKDILPEFLNFLTDTLEFVFCASDLVEMGWDVESWFKKEKGFGHPFCYYLHEYNENMSRFRDATIGIEKNQAR